MLSMKYKSLLLMLLLALAFTHARSVMAEDALTRATNAVTGIIFDYGADEFSTYKVGSNGFVDITFARNTPDALYSEILNSLQNHPDISGVLAGKGGPACPLFN